MKLSYLIKNCSPFWTRIIEPVLHHDTDNHFHNEKSHVSHDPEITSVHANAGEVKPGGLFIAIKGFKSDGHDYINQAMDNGAAAILTMFSKAHPDVFGDRANNLLHPPVVVEVRDSRKAMSSIAARFYGNPSEAMVSIGITGTNGKTTTSFLIESILNRAGYNTGVIGTINYRYANQTFENPVTTPESIDLHIILAKMRDAGVTHVVMEVSSHAIDLHRVRDCAFDVGIFTNLTQDHLDYHKTMAAYFGCKKKFFTKQLKRGKKGETSVAIINIHDPYGQIIATELGSSRAITTAIGETSKSSIAIITNTTAADLENNEKAIFPDSATIPNIFTSNIIDDISGLTGDIHIKKSTSSSNQTQSNPTIKFKQTESEITIKFRSRLTGQFNLENILSAVGATYALGVSPEIIVNGIESCDGVPGRLERIENSCDRYVFVDYAHTPDALESILKTLKMRAPARLISVFGCGGDRDRTKRPIMGEIAYRYSDIAIVTSDNPRSENPDTIISEILEGMSGDDLKEVNSRIIVEPDRAKALETAVRISRPDDIIVAAGKGHETYQITANGKIDFDDRVILKQALINCLFETAGGIEE